VTSAEPARTPEAAPPLLRLSRMTMRFGGLAAVSELDLEVEPGALLGLIGPNGAGKTTVFNVVTGMYAPTSGEVVLDGRPIGGRAPHEIARAGVARTFQNSRLFASRSCRDNVAAAQHCHSDARLFDSLCRTPRGVQAERAQREEARRLLSVFGLEEWRDVRAADLPYGQQRRLEIARALAGAPKLLLLDEPAAGLNPQETEELMRLIDDLLERFGVTVLLIEHDMRVVMGICRRIVVLDHGVRIAEGTPAQIRADARVIEAYLGEGPTSVRAEAG